MKMKLTLILVLLLAAGNLYAQETDCFPVDRTQKEWTGGNISVEDQAENTISISKINPNPADNSTQIEIALDVPGKMQLTAYDIAGKKVSDIFDGEIASNRGTIEWDLKDESGKLLPSGTYFIELKADDGRKVTAKFVVSR